MTPPHRDVPPAPAPAARSAVAPAGGDNVPAEQAVPSLVIGWQTLLVLLTANG